MAESPESKKEKRQLREKLCREKGPLISLNKRRSDWLTSLDRKMSIFITFSKWHGKSKGYWYDVNIDDLDSWSGYEHSFIVFVVGVHSEVLIVPVQELRSRLSREHHTAKDDTYKLHLTKLGDDYSFRELPTFWMGWYRNNYSQLSAD